MYIGIQLLLCDVLMFYCIVIIIEPFSFLQIKISDLMDIFQLRLLCRISSASGLINYAPSTMAEAEVTRSATEQPDVNMTQAEMTTSASEQRDVTGPAGPAGQTDSTSSAQAGNFGTLPSVTSMQWEIHVDFNNGMWWAMPHELSDGILNQYNNGAQQVSFVWSWDGTRWGSYQPDGADTSLSRYSIDFDTMHQRNIDNGRTRKVKVVCVIRLCTPMLLL